MTYSVSRQIHGKMQELNTGSCVLSNTLKNIGVFLIEMGKILESQLDERKGDTLIGRMEKSSNDLNQMKDPGQVYSALVGLELSEESQMQLVDQLSLQDGTELFYRHSALLTGNLSEAVKRKIIRDLLNSLDLQELPASRGYIEAILEDILKQEGVLFLEEHLLIKLARVFVKMKNFDLLLQIPLKRIREKEALSFLIEKSIEEERVDVLNAILSSTQRSFLERWQSQRCLHEDLQRLAIRYAVCNGSDLFLSKFIKSKHFDVSILKEDVSSEQLKHIAYLAVQENLVKKVEELCLLMRKQDKKDVAMKAWDLNRFQILQIFLSSRGYIWKKTYLEWNFLGITDEQLKGKVKGALPYEEQIALIKSIPFNRRELVGMLFFKLQDHIGLKIFIARGGLNFLDSDTVRKKMKELHCNYTYKRLARAYLLSLSQEKQDQFIIETCSNGQLGETAERYLIVLRYLSSLTYLPILYRASDRNRQLNEAVRIFLRSKTFSKKEITETVLSCLQSITEQEEDLLKVLLSNRDVWEHLDLQLVNETELSENSLK